MDLTEQDSATAIRAPDRKKLRRDYLKQRVRAYAGAILCTWLFVPALLVTLGLAMAAVSILIASGSDNPIGYGLGVIIFGILACCSAAAGLFAWSLWQEGIRFIKVEAALVPYAPPVNPDTMPAEEVLVRGSDEPPVAQSEILMRAADGAETPPEELLRVIDP
jgi:hypothetical protein